jgi:hypothetical protein
MEQVTPEGASAPVETVVTPAVSPDGVAPEAVKPAAEPPAKPEGEEPKGVAKRIKELTDARRAAEAREERLLRLLEQRQTPTPQQQAEEDAPAKTLRDFNGDEAAWLKYTEARLTAKADKAAKAAGERYRLEQEAVARRAKFDERVALFAKTVDDFHDVVTDSTPISEGMADFLLDSDEAGAIQYYLGNNVEEARKLYNLSPAKAGRELQRLEDRLVAERKKAAAKPVSEAPPPAPKIEASTSSQALKSTDPEAAKLPGDEWLKLRKKEVAAARKKRIG